jgi:hypothetical protein
LAAADHEFLEALRVSNPELVPSRLAEIEATLHRMPDVDRVRQETVDA